MPWQFYFRLLVFLAHAATAMLFLLWNMGIVGTPPCGQRVTAAYYPVDEAVGVAEHHRWPVNLNVVDTTCDVTAGTQYGLPSWDLSALRCAGMKVQPVWDVPFDPQSYVPGSSWNILVTILLFEWITSSFALFYLDPGDWLVSIIPGLHIIPVLCTVWNLVLLVILWAAQSTIQVTDNNLFVFSVGIVFVVVVQNYMARYRVGDSLNPPPTIVKTVEDKPEQAGLENKFVWRTDHFIRRRPHRSSFVMQGKLDDSDVSGTYPYYDLQYAAKLDSSGEGPVVRFLEYSITAPLLLVCLYLSFSGSALVWTYQAVVMSLCVCNLLGVPLHYVVMGLSSYKGADYTRMVVAGWCALVSSWLAWAAGIFVYVYSARDYMLADPNSTNMPSWLFVLLWAVLLFYSSFGIVITYLYVPPLLGSAIGTTMSSAVMALDVLSPAVKLTVALVVWSKGTGTSCIFDYSSATC